MQATCVILDAFLPRRERENMNNDTRDPVLSDVSLALFHLRRLWIKPEMMKRIRAQTSAGPGGRPLQVSNLMVVHAVAALSAAREDAEG
ncbi:hypothetical protein ACFQ07_18880, partial [Actinomadura adrarensis]